MNIKKIFFIILGLARFNAVSGCPMLFCFLLLVHFSLEV